jgi:hypothetical protein
MFWNVYINVTCLLWIKLNVWKCVCKCYVLVVNKDKCFGMFMWMLHACCDWSSRSGNVYVNVTRLLWIKLKVWKCLCKCYILIVNKAYVLVVNKINVLESLCDCYIFVVIEAQGLEMFMWMFYMLVVFKAQGLAMFMWKLHARREWTSIYHNVYVNVTCQKGVNIKLSHCWCECLCEC